MDIHELKANYPDRFAKAYNEWLRYALDYDWWEPVYEAFEEDNKALALTIDRKGTTFSAGYCQSDHVHLVGHMPFDRWMEVYGYSTTYPALWADAKQYRAGLQFHRRHYRSSSVQLDYAPGNTYPAGVFSELPVEAWDELLREQFDAEDWEGLATETLRSLEADLLRRLRDEAEDLTSEESFIAVCEANEYTFEED